jgi:hypothetical protein
MNSTTDAFRLLTKLHADLDIVNAEQVRCWNDGDGESVGLLVERGQTLVREITRVKSAFMSKVGRA